MQNLTTQRYLELDVARGCAVLAMIFFHTMWDCVDLGLFTVNLQSGFWHMLQTTIASTFLFLVGIGLVLSYNKRKQQFTVYALRRAAYVGIFALSITFFSYLFMPEQYVFFGILHLIATAIALAPLYVPYVYANLCVGIALILFWQFWLQYVVIESTYLAFLGVQYYDIAALDYFPLIPWLGVVLLGGAFGHALYSSDKRAALGVVPANCGTHALAWIGQQALLIYCVHIPIAYALVYVVAVLVD